MFRPIRSRCATCRAPAIPWSRCSAVMLAGEGDFEAAVRAANAAAAVVVGKRGTATVSARRTARAHAAGGLARARGEDRLRLVGARRAARRMAAQGLRIGFTNGCFDLLHPGHVKLLTEARAACDRLIVGLNSDALGAAPEGRGAAGAGACTRAPRCWPRSRRSIWSSSSSRTRRSS